MKKRIVAIALIAILMVCVLPIGALACGGYVSVKGSNTYHFIYCVDVEGSPYKNLRWFDTQAQAEAAGLKPCGKCRSENAFDYVDDCHDSFFETDDHLLLSAFENEFEIGGEFGYESGYEEGYLDGRCSVEYSSGDYSADEIEDAYYDGYGEGYDVGFDEGRSYAEDDIRMEMEIEYNRKIKDARSEAQWETVLVIAIIAIPIIFIVRKKK